MDEGFPEGRSLSLGQRHSRSPGSNVPKVPSDSSFHRRRLSPTKVVYSGPVWKADRSTSPLAGSLPVTSGTTSPLAGSLSVTSGTTAPLAGSITVTSGTPRANGSSRYPQAGSLSVPRFNRAQSFVDIRCPQRDSRSAGPARGNNRRVPLESSVIRNANVPAQQNFEDSGINENILDEMDSQFESTLVSARKLAEAGDGKGSAPEQQKPLNVDEAIHTAAELVRQERLARARDISDLRTKVTSQQEWFFKELSRHMIKSNEAFASAERLLTLETQVEAIRNQMFQPCAASSRERAQGEGHEISQSTLASLHQAILSGPELSQYVESLVDDRVQQAHANSSSISSLVQGAIFDNLESVQYIQKLVDDRVHQVVDAQFGAEAIQECSNAPSTPASVQKAIFSNEFLPPYVQSLVDVRVQQVVDDSVCREVQVIGTELNQELQAFAVRLQEEREMRVKNVHALNSRLASEIARIGAHVETTKLCLQEVSAKHRLSQEEELAEVRAILDTVWAKSSRVRDSKSKDNFFKYEDSGGCHYKECVGDDEDINTLYEMIREAIGNNEIMKRDIKNGKDRHDKAETKVRRHLKQLDCRLEDFQNQLRLLALDSSNRVA